MVTNNPVKSHFNHPSGFGDEARTSIFYPKYYHKGAITVQKNKRKINAQLAW
jgi:hypothetical protein